MESLIFVLILAAVAAFAVYSFVQKQKRREALAIFALQNKLEYSRDDPFGLPDLDFRLFELGDGRGCENVMWGYWRGLPVKQADYWYYQESTDSKGHRSRSYRHFSIVLADLPAFFPQVCLERESLMTRLADALSFRDLEFESEDFNRLFQVRAADDEFAYKLVDARMIRWLLSTGGEFGFEVSGPNLLVWSDRCRPTGLIPLFGSALLFRDHIPRLVWNEYGTGSPASPEGGRSTS
ncbi:MAG: hypothetical protein ACRDHO_06560 [Actinomycetota bacterium]